MPSARQSTGGSPYDEGRECIETSDPGTAIPPPLHWVSWEIHLMPGVMRSVGEDLQRTLVAHRVASILQAGLGSQAGGSPDRVPILLTPADEVDSDGSLGAIARTCANRTRIAIVVSTARPAKIASTAAHELFHAYAFYGIHRGAPFGPVPPWWEEASATWSVGKVGFPEPEMYDEALQYPKALDSSRPAIYPYAMSRFVQFLDDRGLIGDPDWALQRQVIGGYATLGATEALARAIGPTTLGAELGAFWGDRLRASPHHGPQLIPQPWNAAQRSVREGAREIVVTTERLDTDLIDFTLAADVTRVEFDFDPPDENGFFWGLVKPNESRAFSDGDSLSFCVGGGDEDDLEWPGHFPVTFTNGALSGSVTGTIRIGAESGADECTNPELHWACRVMIRAGSRAIFGPGHWSLGLNDAFGLGPPPVRPDTACTYSTEEGRILLILSRWPRNGRARAVVSRKLGGNGTCTQIDAGDIAATCDDGKEVVMAEGRDLAAIFTGGLETTAGQLVGMARGVARELD